MEKELAHKTQVSIVFQLHLQQKEYIEAHNDELRHLSTLVEQQQDPYILGCIRLMILPYYLRDLICLQQINSNLE